MFQLPLSFAGPGFVCPGNSGVCMGIVTEVDLSFFVPLLVLYDIHAFFFDYLLIATSITVGSENEYLYGKRVTQFVRNTYWNNDQ